MTKLVIETAALADCVKKAEKVAPSVAGQAFDKAAGILMEVNPGSPTPVVLRATNLDIYSMEWLSVVEAEGDPVKWRLPSRLLSTVVGSLPIGSGKQVELEDKINGRQIQVHITSGRTKARFNLMDADYYPSWSAFDPDLLTPVQDLGGRLAQVQWAAAKSEPPFSGVNLTGEFAQATDKYRMARAPLKIEGLDADVTIPGGILANLLKQTGEVSIGIDGEQLLVMPDEYSQYRCVLFGLKYPDISKAMGRELPNEFKCKKQQILDILARASNFADSNRDPMLRCFVGCEEFAVMMTNEETGLLGDVIDLTGQATHDRHEVLFTPKNIMEPIQNAPSDEVVIAYDVSNAQAPFRIDGGSGYMAWAMPRKRMEASS